MLQVYAGQWRGLPVAVKVVSQAAPLDGQLAACTAPPHLALVTPFCARGAAKNGVNHTACGVGSHRGMTRLHGHSALHCCVPHIAFCAIIGTFGVQCLQGCSHNAVLLCQVALRPITSSP
jgi:hypothetical protein